MTLEIMENDGLKKWGGKKTIHSHFSGTQTHQTCACLMEWRNERQ